jgi:hypothetical protein
MHQARDTFITTLHIVAAAVIGWRSSENFGAKLSLMRPLKPSVLFFPVFWNLIPYVTKQGVPVPSFCDFTDNFVLSGHTQRVCSCIHIVPYTQVALHIFFKASPMMVSMWKYWMRFISESIGRPPGPWKATAFRALEKHYKSLINTVKSYLLTATCFWLAR